MRSVQQTARSCRLPLGPIRQVADQHVKNRREDQTEIPALGVFRLQSGRARVNRGDLGLCRDVLRRILHSSRLQIGHAFRRDGARAEVIATVENLTGAWQDIEIDLINDYHVVLNRSENAGAVRLSEHFTGGTAIVDNFYDTGRIDREPCAGGWIRFQEGSREWIRERRVRALHASAAIARIQAGAGHFRNTERIAPS